MAGNNMVCFSSIKQLIHNHPTVTKCALPQALAASHQDLVQPTRSQASSPPGAHCQGRSGCAAPRQQASSHRALSQHSLQCQGSPGPRVHTGGAESRRPYQVPGQVVGHCGRLSPRQPFRGINRGFLWIVKNLKLNCLSFTEKLKAPQRVPLTADHLPEEVEQAQEGRQQCKCFITLFKTKNWNIKALK